MHFSCAGPPQVFLEWWRRNGVSFHDGVVLRRLRQPFWTASCNRCIHEARGTILMSPLVTVKG